MDMLGDRIDKNTLDTVFLLLMSFKRNITTGSMSCYGEE